MIAGHDHAKVSRYNKDGWVEDLSDFPDARVGHACVTYTENDGNKVSEVLNKFAKIGVLLYQGVHVVKPLKEFTKDIYENFINL